MLAKTNETTAVIADAYASASTKLDTLIGLVGKTTEEGKVLARMRSDVRRGPNSPNPTPPSP